MVFHCFSWFFKELDFKELDFKELDFKKLDFKELNFKKLDFKKLGTCNLVPEIWYLNYWDCS